MTETTRKKSIWRKPLTDSDKAGGDGQEHREHRYGILSNLLTLLLTGIIIAGGILLPNQLYPYLDRYRNAIVQLEPPSEDAIAAYTFEEPVNLYPWNLYEEQRLRILTSAERDLLDERGIPDFLIASLRDHGMVALFDDATVGSYRTQILSSFHYLEPSNDTELGCYVLYDTDVDADGPPDLRCAVDLQANIISLLFASDNLNALEFGAPVGITPGTTEAPSTDTPTNAPVGESLTPDTAQQQDDTQDVTIDNPADANDTDSGNTGGAPPVETDGDTGTAGAGGAVETDGGAGTGTNPAGGVTADNGALPEFQPPDEERYLWSFAYAISREAQAFNQPPLMRAFRQLEYTYENRWGYPYTSLLGLPPDETEADYPSDEYTPLLPPTHFKTTDYLLNIYNLPDGNRLVLYLDLDTSHCMGFNLQTP